MTMQSCGIRRCLGSATITAWGLTALALCGTLTAAADGTWIRDVPDSVLVVEPEGEQADPEEAGAPAADTVETFFSATCVGGDGWIIGGPDACPCKQCFDGRPCRGGNSGQRRTFDPPGLFQRLAALHDKAGACWTGRVDALILWRENPRYRPLFSEDLGGGVQGADVLNANQLNSTGAAGPRFTLARLSQCGDGIEASYLRAFNFRSQRILPTTAGGYMLSPPGIFGNTLDGINTGDVNLGSALQGFEFNGRRQLWRNVAILGGLRWMEWRESLTIQDSTDNPVPPPDFFTEQFSASALNSLWGLQLGFNVHMLDVGSWMRIDGVVKGAACYNIATQTSTYQDNTGLAPIGVTVGTNPVNSAFVGEVGMTGTVPIHRNIDLTFGYLGLFLEGIAQPTNLLSGQNIIDPVAPPPSGTITTTGNVIVQGVTLGLQARW